MKNIKRVLYTAAIGLMLIAQLLQPASVFADGDGTGTPMPTSTPEVTATPQATETNVETALPTGTPELTITPEETTSPTDVPAVTLTPGPNEPSSEPVVATPIATEFATPNAAEPTIEPVVTVPAPTEFPTEEEGETKVAPTDSSTPTAEPVISDDGSTVEQPSLGEVLSEIPAETEVVVLNEIGQPEPLATVVAAAAVSSGNPVWCPEGVPPGGPGCTTAAYSNLSDLVASFVPTSNGTIWISAGNDSSTSAIVINWYDNWLAARNYSLTIQGGWNGVFGDTTINSNSVFTVPISIDWAENVTVNNLTIDVAGGTGMSTDSPGGNITWNNINVNGGSGSLIHAYNVNVNNSQFTNSTNDGLDIQSGGNADISNSEFQNNKGTGLVVFSDGDILIDNIDSSGNSNGGLSL